MYVYWLMKEKLDEIQRQTLTEFVIWILYVFLKKMRKYTNIYVEKQLYCVCMCVWK